MTASVEDNEPRFFGLKVGSPEPYQRTLGMVSLLLMGVGMLLEAASAYVVIGVAVTREYDLGVGGVLWGAQATLLLLIGFTVLYAAFSVKEGLFPRTMLLVLFLAAISLFLEASATLSSSAAGLSVTISTLAIASGVILLVALFFSATESVWVMLTAAILGLVSLTLLMVRNGDLGGKFAQVGGASLNSYLLSTPVSQSTFAGLANFFATLGILGATSLTYIAYLIAAIGLMFWAILRNSRLEPVAWLTALFGVLLYGVDMAWGNVSALAAAGQGSIDWTTEASPFLSAIVLTVASFVIIAGAGVGLIVHGADLSPAVTRTATKEKAQPEATQPAETKICPNCRTEIPSDSVYCKKCGTKLGSDWFSAGRIAIGKVCVNCGTENPSDHLYCKKCGTKLD